MRVRSSVCICVYVCVNERESVCVYICVCVSERVCAYVCVCVSLRLRRGGVREREQEGQRER